ncbi:MAG TPA: PqqD family protein [Polyangia bacterium]|nr:PqqD family protein [Polyangia bacterium]
MMPSARIAPGVVARNIGGETVLVPTRANVAQFDRIFLLSRVGAFLWPLLDGSRDRDELCRLVRERFAVPSDADVAKDVDEFLAGLTSRGLLQP